MKPPDVISAMRCYKNGDIAGAEALCRLELQQRPASGAALHLLGLISSDRGENEAALNHLQRAIEAEPLVAEYRIDAGVVLERLKRLDEAIAAYRLALEIEPASLAAHMRLGALLARLQRWNDSIASWRAAVQIQETDPEIHNNLGAALYSAGQFEPALLEFARAIELRPDFAEAYNNVGNTLFSRGEIDLAIVAYRKAVSLNPKLTDAQTNLAHALQHAGRRDEAAAAHLRIAWERPADVSAQISTGNALAALNLWQAAAEAYQRALQLDPQNPTVATALGNAFLAIKDLDGAVMAYRRVLALQPDSLEAMNNLGMALKDQGLLDDSLDCCERAVELAPGNAAVHSNLVYLLSFHPGYDPAEISRQQRLWNDRHAAPLKSLIRPHANDRSPDRRLKIGYVSPDLCRHVVGQNLLPLLGEHDRAQFEVHCYSSTARPDAITQLLRQHSHVWHDVAEADDESLAEMIRRDAIDILIDLSLHMGHNRLQVFARKPAPVSATWLGYCASTGLEAIDYRLSDPYLDPPETDLSLYSEQTVHLPETWWCYRCAGPTPEPSSPPSLGAGYITFGCLNNFTKVSPGSLDLWAEILAAVPQSRMIIHAHPGSHRDDARRRFAEAGVEPDRIEFVPQQSWAQYVQTYARIDIALDPFPWGGGITTCDALWMGVPVVTLSGQTAVGRGGRSILSNLGLVELVARRPRQYVQTAVTLASSPARLAELRGDLRNRMLTSPLTNARRFARNIENAYRQMWKQFCQGSA